MKFNGNAKLKKENHASCNLCEQTTDQLLYQNKL